MRRKKIVAGNWKMNTTAQEASNLVREVLSNRVAEDVEKIFFPPFPFLAMACELTVNAGNFYVGAQNCSNHAKGAFTGEVSAGMIHSLGAAYVLIGHSERRAYFNEDAAMLVEKMQQAFANHLQVIYCFGEVLAERKAGKHFDTVKKQLMDVLPQVPKDQLTSLVLAYEPVWAIGTGETASPEQAQEIHAFVRQVLKDIIGVEEAMAMSILYGGSCTAQNAKQLFACADVDGGLIGGASLKAEDFCRIINSF